MASQEILREEPSRGSFVNDPRIRSLFFQTLVVVLLFGSIWWIVQNVIDNLHRLHIASGFGFLKGRAGFDISDTPIAYTSDSTYGRAIIVGLINTIIVAAAGIITATIIGFIIGIGRLSQNWLIQKICTVYV
ncbi:amino acid ABC transporter permease, partial [Mesorhizobium sp. M8A.F.Ca.ET.023.01.1.1]